MSERLALRGPCLSFRAPPWREGAAALRFEPDALILLHEGRIVALDDHARLRAQVPDEMHIVHYDSNHLILPGFIDAHVHYPQVQMIASFGLRLIDWLKRYTFEVEQQYADPEHAAREARVFLDECLRNGTTSACVFGTVHAHSVDALMREALSRDMRLFAGKVLMDRHAPPTLCDTADSGYADSRALITRWHGQGRLGYAITPRFAPTSSPRQLELAGQLAAEHPDCRIQTHIAETPEEVAWARELFPERKDYLDIYAHYGLLGPHTLLGHGIHLSDDELQRIAMCGACVVHCPSSNLFLGSGLLDLGRLRQTTPSPAVALGSDVGAGTSLSLLRTLGDAYRIARLHGFALNALDGLYLATRAGAQALGIADRVGALEPGMEADMVVLDLCSTPLLAHRMRHCRDLEEALFAQMILADDRAIRATWVAGRCLYERADRVS